MAVKSSAIKFLSMCGKVLKYVFTYISAIYLSNAIKLLRMDRKVLKYVLMLLCICLKVHWLYASFSSYVMAVNSHTIKVLSMYRKVLKYVLNRISATTLSHAIKLLHVHVKQCSNVYKQM